MTEISHIIQIKEVYGSTLTIVISYVLYLIGKTIIKKIFLNNKKDRRRLTLVNLFQNIYKYLVVAIALILVLKLFGIDIGALLTGLGILSFVFGLALQDTIRDFFSGFNIIMEDYFSLGDWVTFNTFKGEVIHFSLKTTKLKNAYGEIKCFANRKVDEIINHSKANTILMVDIYVNVDEKVDKITSLMTNIVDGIKKNKEVIDSETEYLGLEELDGTSAIYRLKVGCIESTQFSIKRTINEIIKEKCENQNITFKQIEVHDGKDL